MKKVLLGITIFCFIITGVFAQTWRVPVSDDDFIGRWEGSFIMDIPANPDELMPKTSIDGSMIIEYLKRDTAAMSNLYFSFKLDMEKFMDDFLNLSEVRMLGLDKEVLWEIFSTEVASLLSIEDEFEAVIEEYSIGIKMNIIDIYDFYNQPFDQTDIAFGSILINEANNIMRWTFSEGNGFTLGLGDKEIREINLHKVQ